MDWHFLQVQSKLSVRPYFVKYCHGLEEAEVLVFQNEFVQVKYKGNHLYQGDAFGQGKPVTF